MDGADEDAALGGAVELGDDEAGDAEGGAELADLGESVLAGGGVEDKEDVVRCAGDLGGGDAANLGEFVHEILFGVEAAGGVDEDEVARAGAGGSDGVVNDGTGVGAFLMANEMAPGALGPDFDLFGGGGAEGVCGGEEDFPAGGGVAGGELAGGGGFAGAVDADEEDDAGLALGRIAGLCGGRGGGTLDEILEDGADAPEGIASLSDAAAELAEDGFDGPGTEVGGVEDFLDLFGGFGIELRFARKSGLEASEEARAGFGEASLEAREPAAAHVCLRFRFFPEFEGQGLVPLEGV